MKNKFEELINEYETSLKEVTNKFNVIGYIKVILVIILGVFVFFIITKGLLPVYTIVGLATLVLLIVFWIYHNKLHDKIYYYTGLIAINNRNIDRITGKWADFKDIGEEFIDPEHPYALDLDIVGKKSIFQYLNSTNTWYGRKVFANDLLRPEYSADEIKSRQEAISELSSDTKFSNHIKYYLSKIGVDKLTPALIKELTDENKFLKNKAIKFLLRYVPILTIIFIAAVSIFQFKDLYSLSILLLLMQTFVWVLGKPKNHSYLGTIADMPYKLTAYSTAIDELKYKKFNSNELKKIQTSLSTSGTSAAQAFKELGKISDKINAGHNSIVYFILNTLFLWDYECAFMLEEWKKKYAKLSENWFLTIGEFESLLSFSNLGNTCNNTCLPTIANTDKVIEVIELGHPLLPNDTRVNNNVNINNSIFIISGSNMSGKTTFLRTVGINMVLARTGSFVCAGQMTFSPMHIVTSMRITDDLNEGISTFYAELKRIKTIIEASKDNQNMLFLIDEIFRGTNSLDRLSGAKTVLSKLSELNVTGIITTHDLELCSLENQYSRIKNYSFSEYYKDKKISFDYKMKPGKSVTTNAKYLMEMVGII